MLQRLVPLLADLAQAGGDDDLQRIVVYIATTTRDRERWGRFAEAVRHQVPGGGELMNKTEEMIEIYGDMRAREARQEGELRGKVQTIEGLVGRDVPWSVIEAATGIDQAALRALKQRLEAASTADDDTGTSADEPA